MSDRDPKSKKPPARRKPATRDEAARPKAPQAFSAGKAAKAKPGADMPVPDTAGAQGKSPKAVVKATKAAAVSPKSGGTPPGSEALPVSNPAVKSSRPAKRRAKSAAAMRQARFSVGDVVRHRFYPFRGVVFDIDPVFANTEEWWQAIPEEIRPAKDQPFYHLLAENAETEYVAYVSEQNLIADQTGKPLRHPRIAEMFEVDDDGSYRAVFLNRH